MKFQENAQQNDIYKMAAIFVCPPQFTYSYLYSIDDKNANAYFLQTVQHVKYYPVCLIRWPLGDFNLILDN